MKLAFTLMAAWLVTSALPAANAPQLTGKPNILFILADDLGYGDVGCYNAESKVASRPTGSGRNTQQPYPNLGMTWQQSSFQFVRQVRCKKAVFLGDGRDGPAGLINVVARRLRLASVAAIYRVITLACIRQTKTVTCFALTPLACPPRHP